VSTVTLDGETGEVLQLGGYRVHPAAAVFPMISDEDLAELAEDIKAHGQLEPVWLYDDPELGNVLLDGRNRVRACEIAGVPVSTRVYGGDDPITFSVSLNVKRRHLTPGQRAFLALTILPLYEAEAARRMKAGVVVPDEADPGADLHQGPQTERPTDRAPRATDRAAKGTGASGRATAQAKRVAAEAPDLAEKVKSGEMPLDRAERVIRDRQAEARRVRMAKAEAAKAEKKVTVDIRCGDFRLELADLTDIDAVICDPPYPFEFLPLLDDLAAWADKVLSPDGVLAVLIGQTHLPEVFRRLEGHRPYRWTGCYLTKGPAYVSHPRRVQSNWKPLIVYGGGERFADTFSSSGDDKAHHKWGQNFDAFSTIIDRLTLKGQTVVDPFMGGGTTLLAAQALGRNSIGCDSDPDVVAIAKERLA